VLLDHFLRRQDGVITYAKAREAGLSQTQVRERKASGRWLRVAPQVYFMADREFGDRARLRTAVYAAGSDAAADGLSAAWWHGLTDDLPKVCTVTVPHARRPRTVPGARVRRRDLHPRDLVGFRDLWVTELALTVLESAVLPGGSALLDRALQRRVTLPVLHAAHERSPGRRGAPRAAMLLAAAADNTASAAERIFVKLLRSAGISGWTTAYRTSGAVIDVAFPAQRVAVEVDGWAWHHDIARFQRDRTRQNELSNDGWLVLRFTWHDLTDRPDEVVQKIRRALGRRELGTRRGTWHL